MLPTREEAEKLLEEGGKRNPGPWTAHSRTVACFAERTASFCPGLDAEKAYLFGLLHDIGRRFGVSGIRHVFDGWRFLTALGYGEAARICLTHSFPVRDVTMYLGKIDVPEREVRWLEGWLEGCVYDDYDRLIQLADAVAMPDGTVDMKTRLADVERRYGTYPPDKKKALWTLKGYFERKTGRPADLPRSE